MNDLSLVFDKAVEEVLFSEEWPRAEKIIFIVSCIKVLHEKGWKNIQESRFWEVENVVKEAYDIFIGSLS